MYSHTYAAEKIADRERVERERAAERDRILGDRPDTPAAPARPRRGLLGTLRSLATARAGVGA